MSLENVQPDNTIDGIFATSKQYEGSIVKNAEFKPLLIDYYLDVQIVCDGSNPKYPLLGCRRAIISQYTQTCNIGLNSNDPTAVIIILRANQSLEGIRLVEGQFGKDGTYTPVLLISTKNTSNAAVEVLCWQVFEEMAMTVK